MKSRNIPLSHTGIRAADHPACSLVDMVLFLLDAYVAYKGECNLTPGSNGVWGSVTTAPRHLKIGCIWKRAVSRNNRGRMDPRAGLNGRRTLSLYSCRNRTQILGCQHHGLVTLLTFDLTVAGNSKMSTGDANTWYLIFSCALWAMKNYSINLNEIAGTKLLAILKIVYGPQQCTNHGCMAIRRLNFEWWRLIIVGAQYGACSKSPFWHREFWEVSQIFGKNLCTPYGPYLVFHIYYYA